MGRHNFWHPVNRLASASEWDVGFFSAHELEKSQADPLTQLEDRRSRR
jgi:hypothetical protein